MSVVSRFETSAISSNRHPEKQKQSHIPKGAPWLRKWQYSQALRWISLRQNVSTDWLPSQRHCWQTISWTLKYSYTSFDFEWEFLDFLRCQPTPWVILKYPNRMWIHCLRLTALAQHQIRARRPWQLLRSPVVSDFQLYPNRQSVSAATPLMKHCVNWSTLITL